MQGLVWHPKVAGFHWGLLHSVNVQQMAASSDGVLIERCIDALLSGNIAADDTARLALQNYLQLMQLFQLSLQYVWGLQAATTAAAAAIEAAASTAAAFKRGLSRYGLLAKEELQQLGQGSNPPAGASPADQAKRQLRSLRSALDGATQEMQAAQEQAAHPVPLGSRSAAMDWALLHSISVPQLVASKGVAQLQPLLPQLAYGNVAAEDPAVLVAPNCVQFILLGQCALEYMLHLAAQAHAQKMAAEADLQLRLAAVHSVHARSYQHFQELRAARRRARRRQVLAQTRHHPKQQECGADSAAQLAPLGLQQPVQAPQQAEDQADSARVGGPGRGALVHYGSAASGATLTIPRLHTQPTLPVQGTKLRKPCLSPRDETAAGLSVAERQTYSLKPQSPLTTPRFFQDAAPMTGRAVNMGLTPRSGRHANSSALDVTDRAAITQMLTDEVEDVLRQEQRSTQRLRSDMDDMWSCLCTLKQSAGQRESMAKSLIPPSLPQSSRQQKTKINLDVESLRAEVRTQAQARLRSAVEAIKHRAFTDLTHRIGLSQQGSLADVGLDLGEGEPAAAELQGRVVSWSHSVPASRSHSLTGPSPGAALGLTRPSSRAVLRRSGLPAGRPPSGLSQAGLRQPSLQSLPRLRLGQAASGQEEALARSARSFSTGDRTMRLTSSVVLTRA